MQSVERVLSELGKISTFFPILSLIGDRFAAERPWEGQTIALHLHLTTLTAALVRELQMGGGNWVVSAANPATTDPGVVEHLRDLGVTVYSGRSSEDGIAETLKARPRFFADVGFALGTAAARQGYPFVAGVEISRSGINRLRELDVNFPVVNIDGGLLKPAVECRHGVGEGLWQTFTALTGMHLAGRSVLVIGYGPVGSGVAAYARAGGAQVMISDISPIRRLIAQYDGHRTPTLEEALAQAQVVVTATGNRHALSLEEMRHLPDGAVLINAGHHNDEMDIVGLRQEADSLDQVGERVSRYRIGGRHRVVLAGGNPLNIVMNSGSWEPVLLHFSLLALCLEWLVRTPMQVRGELRVPLSIEEEVARLALRARGLR